MSLYENCYQKTLGSLIKQKNYLLRALKGKMLQMSMAQVPEEVVSKQIHFSDSALVVCEHLNAKSDQ